MKKLLFALLLALGGSAHAVATATPTFTVTPTWTPSPVAIEQGFAEGKNRVYVYPAECYQDDGATIASAQLTPLPGAATVWNAVSLNQNALVLSTGTAATRFSITVPCDYKKVNGSLKLYGMGTISTLTNTAGLCANVFTGGMNLLTSTSGSYLGVTFNVQTGQFISASAISLTTQTGQKLLDSRWSRFAIPLSSTVGAALNPGDIVNFEVVRGNGTSGNISIYKWELEYQKVASQDPCGGR